MNYCQHITLYTVIAFCIVNLKNRSLWNALATISNESYFNVFKQNPTTFAFHRIKNQSDLDKHIKTKTQNWRKKTENGIRIIETKKRRKITGI